MPRSTRLRITRLNAGWLLAFALGLCAPAAHAERHSSSGTLAALRDLALPSPDEPAAESEPEPDSEPPRKRRRVDLSRFSDGPRWVARARGRAFERAQALGIGSLEAARKLLRSGASRELLEAVPGERPRRLLFPVPGGHPGRGFGFTRKIRAELRHNGIDIGAEEGAPVRAAAAGLVVYSDNGLPGYGNVVLVLHPGGLITLYAHNLRTTVQPGWYVERGERIALIGDTGYAWGPHLHFELREGFRPRDPAPLFTGFRSDELAGPLEELGAKASAASAANVTSAPAQTPSADPDRLALTRDALSGKATQLPADQLGRVFRSLLFPLRGGDVARRFDPRRHAALALTADQGAGIRAAADGVVLYSGRELGREPHSIVLLHADQTLTVYAGAIDEPVEAGTRVLRGQWLGRIAKQQDGKRPLLRFEHRSAGKALDPSATLIGP